MKAMFAWPPAAAGPAIRAARGGLSGRRVQAIVIGLVALASTAASTLALGLLVASNAPFDHAFAAQRGADVTATARASAAQLAATTHLPGVTAAAGPFPDTTVTAQIPVSSLPGAGGLSGPGGPSGGPSGGPAPGQTVELRQQLTVVGRSSPGGPVDDLTLTAGHWAQGPGQVVWEGSQTGVDPPVGTRITVTGVPGTPKLTVVGTATSITGSAQAWVTPAELTALRAPGTPDATEMLYRFARAGTSAELTADIASLRA